MEVLSTYCPQEEAKTCLLHVEEQNHLNFLEQDQTADFDDMKRQDGVQWTIEDMPTSETHFSGEACNENEEGGTKLSADSHESQDENIEISQPFVNETESEQVNENQEGETFPCETPLLERDEALAVWVKWRGKWQAGIKCARADWPLSTMRAKPTHDRKKYLVIFFPRTRNFSWADVLLVCPINHFPQPIAYKTHNIGVEMVKDLTLPHRFVMQKIAVGILNIFDQLHREVLVETSRYIVVWKEFTLEASKCKDYPDIGRMLLKIQEIILPQYKSPLWRENLLQSWVQRCQNANSAEAAEMLKEEMVDSILWNDISSLPSDLAQVELSLEWKNCKQEAMKWFSVSNPLSTTCGDPQKLTTDGSSPLEDVGLQHCKKRAKLEVRRPDTHPFQPVGHEVSPIVTGSGIFGGSDVPVDNALLNSEHTKAESNGWGDVIVEAANSEVTPITKNRQCIAFIEAKGRQCVRWANDGDVYCCVHLVSRFSSTTSSKTESTTPLEVGACEGTTVLGTNCKHRSLPGSSFCKKHRPKVGDITKVPFLSPATQPKKRKHEEVLDVDPISVIGGNNSLVPMSDYHQHKEYSNDADEPLMCVGLWAQDGGGETCSETAKRHSLYCEKHLPSWLKRARDGKSRIISKEVFVQLLRSCGQSREQKLHLHQACELFYRLFKSLLSRRNSVPKEAQFQWAIAEASKDVWIREFILKLVFGEKERLKRHWGFSFNESGAATDHGDDDENVISCKICSDTFMDDQELGRHWIDKHNKEAEWMFRGYVCAICLDSFTDKKVLESHVQERHHVEFVEQCVLFQCISCSSHFGNQDQLWSHVLSVHPSNFRLSNPPPPHLQPQPGSLSGSEDFLPNVESINSEDKKFICKFCGMKFDLLPDLGRHHQAAHMGPSLVSSRLSKRGIRFYAYKLKSGRLTRPKFKKSLASVASYRIRSRSAQNIKKRIQSAISVGAEACFSRPPEASSSVDSLDHEQCLTIAKMLFTQMKKTKPRPNNSDILSLARSVCCKVRLKDSLEASYGVLMPERIYLKAAKLCSEQNVLVSWHLDGFICPNGCEPLNDHPHCIPPLVPLLSRPRFATHNSANVSEWRSDESHFVIDCQQIRHEPSDRTIILCDDISFGRESVPITCVVEDIFLGSLHIPPDDSDGQIALPWESFSYVTMPIIDQSMQLDIYSSQLGCSCPNLTCSSQTCDHVYLFENDYEDARDIHGQPMCGRFPYDDRGRIILEEGYVVYECNQRCSCGKSCQNRVLQNGVQVKLEIFKTETKGWAVRAREAIIRGTFVCEFIGEVIDEEEANRRRCRYGKEGCAYFLDIDAQINDMSRLVEGQSSYVIDATNYGNISRYINHSCSPNMANHQVVVESMDYQLAHIGLYANRDILAGEELTFDYHYKPLPAEEGIPCLCGSSHCRGRLY
ncbi:unnamed protein product [Cuscuta epithymum]|uniref:Histone-lysine N-methyltransferase SUVR5 n=1 Tax=Cuscuta epithymum TaxID=186058 RepID=A0AAV0FG22_9ASTE|nr:unnamed protein product [Cuscuta epithymum]